MHKLDQETFWQVKGILFELSLVETKHNLISMNCNNSLYKKNALTRWIINNGYKIIILQFIESLQNIRKHIIYIDNKLSWAEPHSSFPLIFQQSLVSKFPSLGLKIFEAQKIWIWKNVGSEQMLGLKKKLGLKNFGSEKIVGQKKN